MGRPNTDKDLNEATNKLKRALWRDYRVEVLTKAFDRPRHGASKQRRTRRERTAHASRSLNAVESGQLFSCGTRPSIVRTRRNSNFLIFISGVPQGCNLGSVLFELKLNSDLCKSDLFY